MLGLEEIDLKAGHLVLRVGVRAPEQNDSPATNIRILPSFPHQQRPHRAPPSWELSATTEEEAERMRSAAIFARAFAAATFDAARTSGVSRRRRSSPSVALRSRSCCARSRADATATPAPGSKLPAAASIESVLISAATLDRTRPAIAMLAASSTTC